MLKNILKAFAQLKLAVLLLLLIAGFSILGTIIEQEQDLAFYQQNYQQLLKIGNVSIPYWKLIINSGLNNVYNTYWFITLVVIFGLCLLSCTFIQQFPILKAARRLIFFTNKLNYKKRTFKLNISSLKKELFIKRLKNQTYTICQQEQSIYAFRGLIGRFAPIVVHLAMIIVLSGNLVAALGSFKSQELIPKGEIGQIQNVINQKYFAQIPAVPIRINDFWIEYGINNNPKQFFSDISFLNTNGTEIRRKTISVNKPAYYNGLTIYQTDWDVIGLRIINNNKIRQVPIQPISNKKWITIISNDTDRYIILIETINGTLSLFNSNGQFIGNFHYNEKIPNFKNLKITDYIAATGLQIKTDPSIPILYTGLGLLMVSVLISYISYNQFWLLKEKKKNYFLTGQSNRAILNLKQEIQSLRS